MLTKSLAPIASHPKLKGARDTFREANGDSMVLTEPAPKTADGKDDGVWILTMNRLKSKNAFSDEMYLAFSDALNELANDERVKLVIITGKTEFFSSGADLTPGANDPDHLKSGKGFLNDPVGIFMKTLARFPKPVVGAVQGPAIGGGCTMIPHFDLVYCTSNAYFWTPFARIAVTPEFGSSYLFPKIMGVSTANEMLLLSKKLSAERAKQVGLVSEIFPQGPDFLSKVISEVRTGMDYPLIEKSLPMFKNMIKRNEEVLIDQVLNYEFEMLDKRHRDGDIKTAISIFVQKSMAASANKKQKSVKL